MSCSNDDMAVATVAADPQLAAVVTAWPRLPAAVRGRSSNSPAAAAKRSRSWRNSRSGGRGDGGGRLIPHGLNRASAELNWNPAGNSPTPRSAAAVGSLNRRPFLLAAVASTRPMLNGRQRLEGWRLLRTRRFYFNEWHNCQSDRSRVVGEK